MSVLNWIELNWIELNWIELNWIELNWIKLNWIELNWIELNWIELNWIELNWIELNWIKLNWMELNGIEFQSICLRFISLVFDWMWSDLIRSADKFWFQPETKNLQQYEEGLHRPGRPVSLFAWEFSVWLDCIKYRLILLSMITFMQSCCLRFS